MPELCHAKPNYNAYTYPLQLSLQLYQQDFLCI